MATDKVDFDLHLFVQRGLSTDEYYKIFSSTVDTINTIGGLVGLYPIGFKIIKDNEVLSMGKELTALTTDKLREVNKCVKETAKEAATERTRCAYSSC